MLATGSLAQCASHARAASWARTGRLRFELDDRRRWSLWYIGEGPPVPLIQNATLGAWVADQFLTLGDLEYSTLGSRRPPGGDAVVMRGRAGGVYLEAEFLAGPPAAVPLATVSLSIYPDRDLSSIEGVHFLEVSGAEVMTGTGTLTALLNGAHPGSAVQLLALPLGRRQPGPHERRRHRSHARRRVDWPSRSTRMTPGTAT